MKKDEKDENDEKDEETWLKRRKKSEDRKTYFKQLLGVLSTPNLVEIYNTHHVNAQ